MLTSLKILQSQIRHDKEGNRMSTHVKVYEEEEAE